MLVLKNAFSLLLNSVEIEWGISHFLTRRVGTVHSVLLSGDASLHWQSRGLFFLSSCLFVPLSVLLKVCCLATFAWLAVLHRDISLPHVSMTPNVLGRVPVANVKVYSLFSPKAVIPMPECSSKVVHIPNRIPTHTFRPFLLRLW